VADLEKISSSEYAIDGNLSRFAWMPVAPTLNLFEQQAKGGG